VRSWSSVRLDAAEGESLAGESRRARRADAELAVALDRPPPAVPVPGPRLLERMGDRPPLPAALERRLVDAAARGDPRARAQVVEAFLPLVVATAQEFAGAPGPERTALLQEGVVGVLHAIAEAEPGSGDPFWRGARWWVRRAMGRLVAEHGAATALTGLRPLPDGEYERLLDALEHAELRGLLAALSAPERAILRARCGVDRAPEDELRVARRLGLTRARVRELERRALGKLASAGRGTRGTRR
jgi:RNA polymerase sigma factor (sigma-70 family)